MSDYKLQASRFHKEQILTTDGSGSGYNAKVTSRGQLVVSPIEFSYAFAVEVNSTNAFNFVPPITGKRFVITDVIIEAGKTVSTTTAADVVLYEAASITATAVSKLILTFNMIRFGVRTLNGLNLIVGEGKWLNITTTDPTVNATVMGYYINA